MDNHTPPSESLPILSLIEPPRPELVEYYETVLYPLQDRVLSLCAWPDQWVLSGGTAISRFMAHHRFSDDLDFFFYDNDTETFLRHCVRLERALRNSGLTLRSEVKTDYFRRYFIEDGEQHALKIECILEPEPRACIGSFRRVGPIMIDSLENLAVNKLNALIGRNLARDLYDLWHLEGSVSFPAALDLSKRAYGGPVERDDLLVVADRIHAPDLIPVYATKVPDLPGFSAFLARVSEEVIRRISLEAETIKKKLRESVDLLFWDAPPPTQPLDRFFGEAASRIIEYGSSALLAALPPGTLQAIFENARRPLRISEERLLFISGLVGKQEHSLAIH